MLTPQAYLPAVMVDHPPPIYRVVHVHADTATHWEGEDAYWEHVDQAVVDNMVGQGLMRLVGEGSVADAWRAILPDYQPGQKIAIKVNFNNTLYCDSTVPVIDALIHPVNAIVSGLEQIGVARADVCVYDAIRALPDRFADAGLTGVSYFDGSYVAICRNEATFNLSTPESMVTFYPPPGHWIPEQHVTEVLMNATYLINVPIMKGGHDLAGVTLGFKNHLGTINHPGSLHTRIDVKNKPPEYRSDYNPLVDLMRSPLIGGKTVLTVGDGLFAARVYNQRPELWTTFGGKLPNSLFLSRDPVAVDCVMYDFLAVELGASMPTEANRYLYLAAQAGLGVYESVNPHTASYRSIDYRRVEL